MRGTFSAAMLALLFFAPGLCAQAQQVVLSDGSFASTGAYLAGTWKWERPQPRQTMIMRFGEDGAFFFHNFTVDLQHWGTWRASGKQLAVSITRSCESQGANCESRNPPMNLDYTLAPTSANVFMSNAERWERLK